MKIIKELSEMISEEIDDAEKYIRHAIECKDTDRQLANTFAELSNQEMNHMNTLHGEVARIIQEYKDKNGDPPKEMMALGSASYTPRAAALYHAANCSAVSRAKPWSLSFHSSQASTTSL